MAGVLLLVVVTAVLLLAALGAVVSLGGAGRGGVGNVAMPDLVTRHERLMSRCWALSLVAVVLLLVLAAPALTLVAASSSALPTGLVPALLPLVVGLLVVAVLAAGERTWPSPGGEVRHASLAARSLRTTTPRWPRLLILTWCTALLVLLVWCGIVGDAASLTYAGTTTAGEAITSTNSPFPGWAYGIPTLVGLGALLALAWWALELVRRRPAVASVSPSVDEELRRRGSGRILRVTQAAVGLTLAGNAWYAGIAMRNVTHGWDALGASAPWWAGLGVPLAVGGLVVALVSLVTLLVPSRAGTP